MGLPVDSPAMRILLSNDDGILAPGLAALRHAVADMGEVTVVAPDSPQSAAGHAITLRRALTVQRVHLAGPEDMVALSVDGRPADCVRLAVRSLMSRPPDLVLSGINLGANVPTEVTALRLRLEADPRPGDVEWLRARALGGLLEGRPGEVVALLEGSPLLREEPALHADLASAFWMLDDRTRARAVVQQGLALRPDDPILRKNAALLSP